MKSKKLFNDKYVGYHTFGLKVDCKQEEQNIEHDYSKEYLTFEALEDTEFSIVFNGDSTRNSYITQAMRESFSYSIDDGKTWETFETPNDEYIGTALTTPTIHAGKKVLWKGIGTMNFVSSGPIGACCRFTSSGRYIAYGNIMSIIYGDMFIDKQDLENNQNILSQFFNNNTYLISAKNLILPAITLTAGCYSSMFGGCTGLITAPKLLPATTLAPACYAGMFQNCTGLTTAPELSATTLVSSCCSSMFYNCSSLNYIKAMFITTPSASYTENWVGSVSSSGTFVKNSAATWDVTGNNGIPSGWTVQSADE